MTQFVNVSFLCVPVHEDTTKMAALSFFGVTEEVIKSTKDAFKCGATLFKQKI